MKKIVAVTLLTVLGIGLSGCSQGMDANTTIQGETGNGTRLTAGEMSIEALTIVAGDAGAAGAVSGVLVNSSAEADALTAITVDGKAAAMVPARIPVQANAAVKIEAGSDVSAQVPLSTTPGHYVEVTLDFARSGRVTGEVLVVPAISFYETAAPAASSTPTPQTSSPAPTSTTPTS